MARKVNNFLKNSLYIETNFILLLSSCKVLPNLLKFPTQTHLPSFRKRRKQFALGKFVACSSLTFAKSSWWVGSCMKLLEVTVPVGVCVQGNWGWRGEGGRVVRMLRCQHPGLGWSWCASDSDQHSRRLRSKCEVYAHPTQFPSPKALPSWVRFFLVACSLAS